MDVKQAYDNWADQYDTNQNKTRDIEAISLRTTLAGFTFNHCLEIGCGTGKNTGWILTIANKVTAVDLSPHMLKKAREKIKNENVQFHQADIKEPWEFAKTSYDLITFSLVLEHIEDLNDIFKKAASVISPNGYIYVGELHPFKQYSGTKARFETADGLQIVPCFNHHISDFTNAAKSNGFEIAAFEEYFHENDRSGVPSILTLLIRKINTN